MSLLGLMALITGFVSGGADSASVPQPSHPVLAQSRMAANGPSHHKLPRLPLRPQANDSDDGTDYGSSADDLTASLDDDHYHITALVWERLIAGASITLHAGNQLVSLESAVPNGWACGDVFNLPATSLRSWQVRLQI